jgi:hypothetical protein
MGPPLASASVYHYCANFVLLRCEKCAQSQQAGLFVPFFFRPSCIDGISALLA